ncbi:hypothetical protein OSB04_003309 [Centaurea solstitialis]|uniref:Myb-like domain-containing protein n=1 Tax=Centaurea solstitialis TaxID=347529 RepID=A0AA38TUL8_9ASTR|nr:hypothetical protein OSB04_003309 [Centaurea solstitialis]
MVQKRQLAEKEYDVSAKHLKLEHSCELVPSLQFTKEEVPYQSDKDEGCFFKPNIGVDSGFISGKFTDVPAKDVDYTLAGSLSTSSLTSGMTSEDDVRSEYPLQTPDHSPLKPRTLTQREDAYSCLLGHPPLKEVPVGPNYQADIPEWRGYDAQYASQTSQTNTISYYNDELKFMGSCVISMPEDPAIHGDDTVGKGRSDCYCKNPGSVGCTQQHIKEGMEILKGSIGDEKLAELGFGNMGELVAQKWTEDDEQLFHEVVYSNPVSLGRNFWHHLAEAFPSRTNQEIVSYYFNVFMLRRRAEQNRRDPMNVDSDDDEWHGSERSEEDYSCQDEIHVYDSYEHGNGIDVGIPCNRMESINLSELQSRKSHNSSSIDSTSQPCGEGDCDLQYDSCTSSDTAGAPCVVDSGKLWANHEFIFEPSDSKAWDVGYFSCSRTKTDFLPTGSMIEEVFGVGSWNFEVTEDDKNSN